MGRSSVFARFARRVSLATGQPAAFILAALVIVGWAASGPIVGFSDTWQLVINTTTTIATFLMVFLIQSTQNRDAAAAQIKLDELIRVVEGAHLALLDLEELSDGEIEAIHRRYERLAEEARSRMRDGGRDTGVPELD